MSGLCCFSASKQINFKRSCDFFTQPANHCQISFPAKYLTMKNYSQTRKIT
jgi:hypothetical protein